MFVFTSRPSRRDSESSSRYLYFSRLEVGISGYITRLHVWCETKANLSANNILFSVRLGTDWLLALPILAFQTIPRSNIMILVILHDPDPYFDSPELNA